MTDDDALPTGAALIGVTANLAFIPPIFGGRYIPGDFVFPVELATGETQSDAKFIKWIPVSTTLDADGNPNLDDVADALREAGYRVVGGIPEGLDYTVSDEYALAKLEPIGGTLIDLPGPHTGPAVDDAAGPWWAPSILALVQVQAEDDKQ